LNPDRGEERTVPLSIFEEWFLRRLKKWGAGVWGRNMQMA
jgi:hypothetical protein